jgi:thymidylate synthase ThyX
MRCWSPVWLGECARNILPMCTPTRLHMQGTLRDWIFYVGLRGANGTQKEHKYIAHDIGRILSAYVPTTVKAVLASENPAVDGWRVIENLYIS